MKSSLPLLLIVLTLVVACGPKRKRQTLSEYLELTKQLIPPPPKDVSIFDNDEGPKRGNRFYYSAVQILTETVKGSDCKVEQSLTEKKENDYVVVIDETGAPQFPSGRIPFYYVLNLNIQAIGFDNSVYRFSVTDGIVPKEAPYGLKIRRRPGNIIQMEYLDKVIDMNFKSIPIYTFIASEKRGACTIAHNVNLFTEKSGYHPFPTIESE